MSKAKLTKKVASFCRLLQMATEHVCDVCNKTKAFFLVSLNTPDVRNPERCFLCEGCFEDAPKVASFEAASQPWLRLGNLRDIRMVDHAHTVGYGSGMTDRFTSRGNGTAALKFEE